MDCRIAGIRFNNVNMSETVAEIVRMAKLSDKPRLVCTANIDHLATIQDDCEFASIYQNADFIVADGMPLVWLSKLAGTPLKERVAGSNLFWELGKASADTGLKLFYLGGLPGSAEAAASRTMLDYPGSRVVGTYCPPFGSLGTPEEESRIAEAIRESCPDILLVGLGSPKQEKWIAANRYKLGVPVSIGVGASFDMAAGAVTRAPRWLQNVGLEWAFRLLQEPRRLWDRYLAKDLPYLIKLYVSILRSRTIKHPELISR